jgi:hypothetical protein
MLVGIASGAAFSGAYLEFLALRLRGMLGDGIGQGLLIIAVGAFIAFLASIVGARLAAK